MDEQSNVWRLRWFKPEPPLWFQKMTPIGPMTTPNESEAAMFASEEVAQQHPANLHLLCSFKPELGSRR